MKRGQHYWVVPGWICIELHKRIGVSGYTTASGLLGLEHVHELKV